MKRAGQIALMPFPFTDLSVAKLRPVLLLRPVSRQFDDGLVCMVSSQIHQACPTLDEFMLPKQHDFLQSGLKVSSVFRLSRLAVLNASLLVGSIGHIEDERLARIKQRLSSWFLESE